MPLLLQDREFVIQQVWRKDDNESISVAVRSLDDTNKIDYGMDFKKIRKVVRGSTKAIFKSTNLQSIGKVPQCKITLTQQLDAGGEALARQGILLQQ